MSLILIVEVASPHVSSSPLVDEPDALTLTLLGLICRKCFEERGSVNPHPIPLCLVLGFVKLVG